MGARAFRSPQEEVEKYKNALDIISLIQEITRDPKIRDTVKDLTDHFIATETITEKKRKEAQEAAEKIKEAEEALTELEKLKNEHSATIAKANSILDGRADQLRVATDELNQQKSTLEAAVKKHKQEVDQAYAQATKIQDESIQRYTKAEKLEALHAEKTKKYEQTMFDAEQLYHQRLDDLKLRETQHDERSAKLAADAKSFELRKQKFENALKE